MLFYLVLHVSDNITCSFLELMSEMAQLSLVAELFNVSLVSYLVVVTWLEKSGL
jgi:hypothetical protein